MDDVGRGGGSDNIASIQPPTTSCTQTASGPNTHLVRAATPSEHGD